MTGGERDAVGDLNAESIRAGEFPGSFKIPGDSVVSLAIGGIRAKVDKSQSRSNNDSLEGANRK